MPTLNVCVEMYMNNKITQNLFKLQIFIFFSEALSMYEKYCNLNKFYLFFYSYIYIYTYTYTYICM